jgi:hypothetical protein
MRRVFLLVLLIVGVASMLTGTAVAREKHLRGDYAYAGEMTCIGTPLGFNSYFVPLNNSGRIASTTSQGVRTFNGDGTGTEHIVGVQIMHPQFAISYKIDLQFTYTVEKDGAITADLVPGTFMGTYLSGPLAGQTFTQTPFTLSGMVSEDGKIVTLASGSEPQVVTTTNSDGTISYNICHRSRIMFKLDDHHPKWPHK